MASESKLFQIRNANGQNLGTWYAKNATLALRRAEDELNAGANAFRRSWTRVSLADATATEIAPRAA